MSQTHFNGLTPGEHERLALLAEECGEVIQAIGKIMRHGYESRHPDGGPTNRESLEREIGHVEAAKTLLSKADDIRPLEVASHTLTKLRTVKLYLHHQEGDKQ